jgi:hypothetical protein
MNLDNLASVSSASSAVDFDGLILFYSGEPWLNLLYASRQS